MNRRTLKKECKRAVKVLCERHGYRPEDFSPADGSESIYAPSTMERQYTRFARPESGDWGFLDPGPLKGTPLLWRRVSYEYDEWDCELASEFLEQLEFEQNYEPTPEDLAA